MSTFRIVPAGDSALIVEFDERVAELTKGASSGYAAWAFPSWSRPGPGPGR